MIVCCGESMFFRRHNESVKSLKIFGISRSRLPAIHRQGLHSDVSSMKSHTTFLFTSINREFLFSFLNLMNNMNILSAFFQLVLLMIISPFVSVALIPLLQSFYYCKKQQRYQFSVEPPEPTSGFFFLFWVGPEFTLDALFFLVVDFLVEARPFR